MPVFEAKSGENIWEVNAPDMSSAQAAARKIPGVDLQSLMIRLQPAQQAQQAQQAQPKPSLDEDVARSVVSGGATAVNPIAAMGDLANVAQLPLHYFAKAIGVKSPLERQQEIAEKLHADPESTSSLYPYQPTSKMGQYAKSMSTAALSPVSYAGGAGSPLAKLFAALFGGAGAQLGSDITRGSPLGTVIGGTAGALFPGGAAAAARQVSKPLFPVRDPQHAVSAQYLQSKGVNMSAGDLSGRESLRIMERLGQRPGGGESYYPLKTEPLEQYTEAATKIGRAHV